MLIIVPEEHDADGDVVRQYIVKKPIVAPPASSSSNNLVGNANVTSGSTCACPDPLLGLSAIPSSTSLSITLNWNPSAGATSYRIERTPTDTKFPFTTTSTSYIDPGLLAGTMYSYTVYPVNGAGDGKSATISTTTASPPQPVIVTATSSHIS
ncbi:MAG TPA: fibronectin type III domain-containing protein, partial [Candidatus Nitrosotenuis sp.]